MAHDTAVEVRNVKKSFFLPHHKNDSLKSAITQAFKPKEKGGNTFKALDGITFNVEKGDFFGILGRNGSGKSTLLKIISQIYQPTSGSVKTRGKVVSFIELGVGFKSELSGRENVFLNGALLGFSKQEIAEMYDEIVEFAELEEFMDQKLKNYSSGMKVRLAFSVAIRAKADILILDEVLAVGDAAFQKKCYDYFGTLKEDGKTVILVTHSMGNVRKFCNKAVVIDGGKVLFEGGAEEAADAYLRLFIPNDKKSDSTKSNDKHLAIDSMTISPSQEKIEVETTILSHKGTDRMKLGIALLDEDKRVIAGVGSYRTLGDQYLVVSAGERKQIKLTIDNIVGYQKFYVRISVFDDDIKIDSMEKVTINPAKQSYYPIVPNTSIEALNE